MRNRFIIYIVLLSLSFFIFPNVHAKNINGLEIITRAEWGADESLRFKPETVKDKNGVKTTTLNEIWKPTYADVYFFVIHHTATDVYDVNDNFDTDSSDYKSIVRAIYKHHAVNNGWGDIGYNYLIDSLGNIYEGRYGGDGVIGGHVFNSGKNIGYNTSSMGIAFLGNYDMEVLSDKAVESFYKLVSNKAHDFSIDFNSPVPEIKDLKNVEVITTHRDLDSTECPGDYIYSQIPDLTEGAKNYYSIDYGDSGRIFDYSIIKNDVFRLRKGECRDISVSVLNSSNFTWHNFGNMETSLVNIDESINFRLKENSVNQGEIGNFVYNICYDDMNANKKIHLDFKNGLFDRVNTSGDKKVDINVISQKDNIIDITSAVYPSNLKKNKTFYVDVTIKNSGTNNINLKDLKLMASRENGSVSDFYNKYWSSSLLSMNLHTNSKTILKPGEFIVKKIYFGSKSKAGDYSVNLYFSNSNKKIYYIFGNLSKTISIK